MANFNLTIASDESSSEAWHIRVPSSSEITDEQPARPVISEGGGMAYDPLPDQIDMLRWKFKAVPFQPSAEEMRKDVTGLELRPGVWTRVPDTRIANALHEKLLWHDHPKDGPLEADILLVAAMKCYPELGDIYPDDPRRVWNNILGKIRSIPQYSQMLGTKIGIPPRLLESSDITGLQKMLQAGIDALFNHNHLKQEVIDIHLLVYITQALNLALHCWEWWGASAVRACEMDDFLGSIMPEWNQSKREMHASASLYLDPEGIPILKYATSSQQAIATMKHDRNRVSITEQEMGRALERSADGVVQQELDNAMRNYLFRKYMVPPTMMSARHMVSRRDFTATTKEYGRDGRGVGMGSFQSSWKGQPGPDELEVQEDERGELDDIALVQEGAKAVETILAHNIDGIASGGIQNQTEEQTQLKDHTGAGEDVDMEDMEESSRSVPPTPRRQRAPEGEKTTDNKSRLEQVQAGHNPPPVVKTLRRKRFRPKKAAAEYVAQIEKQIPAPRQLDVAVTPIYDEDNKPSRLDPPFVLASVEHMLGSDLKWEWLLDAHPEYADNISRLGVMLPSQLQMGSYENIPGERRFIRKQVNMSSEECLAWLQSADLKAKLASHGIFIPHSLPQTGPVEALIKVIQAIHRKLLLKARDYICEMEVKDASLLSAKDDIIPADLPIVNFDYDVFRNQTVPLPEITLRRVVNFLKDSDVDRTIGWKTAVGELREYLQHLMPMSRGMKWAKRMREAASLLAVHEVFEDYFYGAWDFPLGVNMVERPVRLKAPKGVYPILYHHVQPDRLKEVPPHPRLLERQPVPVSDAMYGEIGDKKRDLYPYLTILATHETALWMLPIRSKMTRDMMDKWLLEHGKKSPSLNPLGINAAIVENDGFETCILRGPGYTVEERRTFSDQRNDKMLDPLLKLAIIRGNLRAGLQQCLQQINHRPMQQITTPWRRVHFPTPAKLVKRSQDAGHVYNPIALKPDQLTNVQKRAPFAWTTNMISYRAQINEVAHISRRRLDATSQYLHEAALYPQLRADNQIHARQMACDMRMQTLDGQVYATQRMRADKTAERQRQSQLSGMEAKEDDEEMSGTRPSSSKKKNKDGVDPVVYPVRLPPNFRGPFLYSDQKFLHETWTQQLRRLESVYPVLQKCYRHSPRALLRTCLEHIHDGKVTPEHVAQTHVDATNKGPISGWSTDEIMEQAGKTVYYRFNQFVDRIRGTRYECDFGPYEAAKRKDHLLITDEGMAPKMVSEENIQHLLMLTATPRNPESIKPLEPRHPLFLSFWDRLCDIMYSNHSQNPWAQVNARVPIETVMSLVNEGPGSSTESCRRFTFARSDVFNYIERLHDQKRVYYERGATAIDGVVLRPELPENENGIIYPEARLVWDVAHQLPPSQQTAPVLGVTATAEHGVRAASEYPSYVEPWDATLDSYARWHNLKTKAEARGKGIEDFIGTKNFMVAPKTVDYFISASYRLGYTIRLLKHLLRKAPAVSKDLWGPDQEEANANMGDERVPPRELHARLAAWEAATVDNKNANASDLKVPTLREVVRLSDSQMYRPDMTEREAQDLIRLKLIEEAQRNHTMLWPARKVTYVDKRSGESKVAVKRDDVWGWAHPDVIGACNRRFFSLDKWPLAAASESTKKTVMEDLDINERLLANPLAGDVSQNHEHYRQPTIGDHANSKHVPGDPGYHTGDTPRKKQFYKLKVAAMSDPKLVEPYTPRPIQSDHVPSLSDQMAWNTETAHNTPGNITTNITDANTPVNITNPNIPSSSNHPATTSSSQPSSSYGHKKRSSSMFQLFNNTFRKPWIQNPLPATNPDIIPHSLEPEEAQAKIRVRQIDHTRREYEKILKDAEARRKKWGKSRR